MVGTMTSGTCRVDRLAFSPNFWNLAFVVGHEKMLFGMYVIFGLFQWRWQKKRCLAFF